MMSCGQETELPAQAEALHFVIVTLGQRLFAIDTGAVQGIVDASEVANTLTPEFQGDVYQAIDRVKYLAIRSMQERRSGQIVLLMLGRKRGSIGVEHVYGRMDLHASQILPLPPHFQGAERDWYRGMILFENSVAVILNLAWFLQSTSGILQNQSRFSHRPTDVAGSEMPRSEC